MKTLKLKHILLLLFFTTFHISASEKLIIDTSIFNISLLEDIAYFEDSSNKVLINDIIDNQTNITFNKSLTNLNLGLSKSSHWFKVSISNTTKKPQTMYLEIRNPDIAHADFYVFDSTSLIKNISTGELHKTCLKEVVNRQHVVRITLNSTESKTIFVRVHNEGRFLYVPIYLIDEHSFFKNNFVFDIINWFIYGIIFFICFFNIYLFSSTKSKTNVFITAYILSGLLFLFYYDGYHFLLNMPAFSRNFKFMTVFSFSIFMLLFARFFTNQKKFRLIYLRIIDFLLLINFILPFTLIFGYPIAHIGEQGARIMVGVSIIKC